jgi:hypothetical protein
VDDVALYDLMGLVANEKAAPEVRAMAGLKLEQLKSVLDKMQAMENRGDPNVAHWFWGEQQIAQFQKDPKSVEWTMPAEPPDGPPIGMEEWELMD